MVVYVYKNAPGGVVVVWPYPERSTKPVLLFSAAAAVEEEEGEEEVVGKVLTVWEVKRRKEGRRGGQLGRNSVDYFWCAVGKLHFVTATKREGEACSWSALERFANIVVNKTVLCTGG